MGWLIGRQSRGRGQPEGCSTTFGIARGKASIGLSDNSISFEDDLEKRKPVPKVSCAI